MAVTKMMWSRSLDEKLKENGWLLDKKDDYGVVYKKIASVHIYTKYKVVKILHNQFASYSSIPGISEEPARLTYKELRLFEKKFKQLKKEYGWK